MPATMRIIDRDEGLINRFVCVAHVCFRKNAVSCRTTQKCRASIARRIGLRVTAYGRAAVLRPLMELKPITSIFRPSSGPSA